MPKGFLRVAAVSLPVQLGNVNENAQRIIAAVQKLQAQGVQAAVFPELCLTGATMGDMLVHVLKDAWQGLLTVAEATGGMAVVVGLPVAVRGSVYNCAAVLHDGKVQGFVPKTRLTSEEMRQFSPGVQTALRLGDADCPVSTGLRFETPDGSASFAVTLDGDGACDADVLLCPSADRAFSGTHAALRRSLMARSSHLRAALVHACAGFGESTADQVYDGYTAVCENGEMLAEGPRFAMDGGVAVADIDVERLRHQRRTAACLRPAQEEGVPVVLALQAAPMPLVRPVSPAPFIPDEDGLEEMTQMQCAGLATRLRAIRAKTLVIGVSGGLDSTLALLAAVRTFDLLGLDRKGIHAITMPGMGTGARTRGNADRLMELLGVTALEVPIAQAVRQHFADIGHDEGLHDVTYENAQARERTQILMDYANKVGGIVLGTGDLSELALGFCTYNGDHMSMYAINASVPKTLVRALTAYQSRALGAAVHAVCMDVIDTPVSPELLPVSAGELNQRTEDILGDYDLHDFFIYHFITGGASREKLLMLALHAFAGRYDEAAVARVLDTFLRRFRTQQFKRSCMPDGPQVTPVSFSPRGAWHMPSDM